MQKNILIVDDEELILENLKLLLEDVVDNVYTALNGYEGLEVLRDKNIYCVISDINMPRMGGIDFIKQARSEKFEKTPFIFFTAHGNQELMMEAVKYGAFDFLDKPDFDGLEEVVNRGIAEGFKLQSQKEEPTEDDILSSYNDLLKQAGSE
jgi:DNA-binding NtrC family response regulator